MFFLDLQILLQNTCTCTHCHKLQMSEFTGLPPPRSSSLMPNLPQKLTLVCCTYTYSLMSLCQMHSKCTWVHLHVSASLYLFLCLCPCLQRPVQQSWKTWVFLMNSAIPPCGHPFAYLGTTLGEGLLRTLKVTAEYITAVATHEPAKAKWEN